jgi:hypothetical protein
MRLPSAKLKVEGGKLKVSEKVLNRPRAFAKSELLDRNLGDLGDLCELRGERSFTDQFDRYANCWSSADGP